MRRRSSSRSRDTSCMTDTVAATAPSSSRTSVEVTDIVSGSRVSGSVSTISPLMPWAGSSRNCETNDVNFASLVMHTWAPRPRSLSERRRA